MPDRYDPVTAEQARPIIAGIVFNAINQWSDVEVMLLERDPRFPSITHRFADFIAGELVKRMTPGQIDACDRVREAMTKMTWGHDPIDEAGP